MREAPVGWQCASCVRDGARQSPAVRWRASAAGSLGTLGRVRVTPAVIGLIIVNVAVYVWERPPSTFEAKYWLVSNPLYFHWYQLITSAFLHENPTHILFNMIMLAIVGPALEAAVGTPRFIGIYLLSAVGGSVGFYVLAPENVAGLGASGAIFGVMGAYLVLAALRRWELQSILGLLFINLIYSFVGNVAWQAHLGGLLIGALSSFGMMWVPKRIGRPSEAAELVQALAVAVVVMVVLAALVQLPPGHFNV
jgi:membrane associated rhomboid family serine protease